MEASYLFLPKRSARYITISLSLRAGTLQAWGDLRWPPFFSVTVQFQGMNKSGQQGQGDVEDRQSYQEDCRHQRCLREELGNHRANPKKYRWDQDGGKVRSHERCGWHRHDDKTTRCCWVGMLSNAISQRWSALFQSAVVFHKIESDSSLELPRIVGSLLGSLPVGNCQRYSSL